MTALVSSPRGLRVRRLARILRAPPCTPIRGAWQFGQLDESMKGCIR